MGLKTKLSKTTGIEQFQLFIFGALSIILCLIIICGELDEHYGISSPGNYDIPEMVQGLDKFMKDASMGFAPESVPVSIEFLSSQGYFEGCLVKRLLKNYTIASEKNKEGNIVYKIIFNGRARENRIVERAIYRNDKAPNGLTTWTKISR